MEKQRPVNLDLSKFRFPLPAITSILHRIAGVALFVGVGFLLWALDASLSSEQSFNETKEVLDGFFVKVFFWAIVSILLYHIVAGTKHLIMDLGFGETLEGGLKGAKVTLVVSAVLILLAGVWIW
ncbi:MAG: succinate dehydrogenase, cytochrome b556 subunit [Gammaproteobacteria bacterium]|nr:MAG: succinate dehydrogenase, cytochrome b556 subunit [Gammaproteobacteria bacterium]